MLVKQERKNLSKMMILFKNSSSQKPFLKKIFLHLVRHFCENLLMLFLLAMMIW